MATPILVFDLDGTLADTNRDLIPVLNRVTARMDLPQIALEDVGHVVGHGAKAMIERAFTYHGRTVSPEELEILFAHFLTDYEANIADNTVLYEGVLDAMDTLEEQGWQFAVCTNKLQHLSEKLLHALAVTDRFNTIAGANRFDFKKPDPRHLTQTIIAAGGDPQNAVMVGDSITDIKTAKAAAIPVIAVDFGYSEVPVKDLDPDQVISHFTQLPASVEKLRQTKLDQAACTSSG